MISIHCLRTHVVLWLSGKIACLVNREIPGSNPGSASFSYHTFVYNYVHHVSFSNDFHPLSTYLLGAVA